jgi:hypothetical protein
MKALSKILTLILALFCSGFTNEGTWIIDANSTLTIHGATNLNTFTCSVDSYTGHDTLQYFNNYAASELQFTDNRMTIPIQKFDCGSRQISKDFRTTLKSETHPDLNIRFISLGGNSLKNQNTIDGRIDIVLAGVTKRYTVRFKTEVTNQHIVLSGVQPVNFGDFNLKAPEKLQGIIRVKEVLRVEFYLVLKPV